LLGLKKVRRPVDEFVSRVD